MLDSLIPTPGLVEVDRKVIAAPAEAVWDYLRHGDLGKSPLIRALFALRTLPDRLRHKAVDTAVRIDDLKSTPERPGFQILWDDPPREFSVGAIGKVWQAEIPFVHVTSIDEFNRFDTPDYIKVAWSVRVNPRSELRCEVEFELRVAATDEAAWAKFRRYFAVIGPASHFIRRTVLSSLVDELGSAENDENQRALVGDELLPNAAAQETEGITIRAKPERIWPWLLQMGCQRAGFYAIDALDNAGAPSARELHPELLKLELGQVIPATPDGKEGFEVLKLDAPRTLVLGGLYDSVTGSQLPFHSARPPSYWQVTWAFVLEPLNDGATRLHVRARAAFTTDERLHLALIRPVHRLMQAVMLRNLAQRAEGCLRKDSWSDVADGVSGAAIMLLAFASPFMRRERSHWGLDEALAARAYPGDELVPEPNWAWSHGVEIDVPASRAWPWLAQIGADRGGFYSYQWLENLVGCGVHNAERVHPEWQVELGQPLLLHPDARAPRMTIVALEPGKYLVASGPAELMAREAGRPWVAASWLFFVEPLSDNRCRVVSRYRTACSADLATRLAFGPTLIEPVGFAMDRRMLLGVKERAERWSITSE